MLGYELSGVESQNGTCHVRRAGRTMPGTEYPLDCGHLYSFQEERYGCRALCESRFQSRNGLPKVATYDNTTCHQRIQGERLMFAEP